MEAWEAAGFVASVGKYYNLTFEAYFEPQNIQLLIIKYLYLLQIFLNVLPQKYDHWIEHSEKWRNEYDELKSKVRDTKSDFFLHDDVMHVVVDVYSSWWILAMRSESIRTFTILSLKNRKVPGTDSSKTASCEWPFNKMSYERESCYFIQHPNITFKCS